MVVNYASYGNQVGEVVSEIRNADGEALAIKADVSKPVEVEQLFRKTVESFGRMDVVVNNAGVMPLAPTAKEDVDAFDNVIGFGDLLHPAKLV